MTEFNPGGAADLNDAVKRRYEANADTNVFSDADKAALAAAVTSDPGATGGGIIANVISVTQAQYDAIATKDPQTLYVING